MDKKSRKLLSLLLVFVLSASLTGMAYADEYESLSENEAAGEEIIFEEAATAEDGNEAELVTEDEIISAPEEEVILEAEAEVVSVSEDEIEEVILDDNGGDVSLDAVRIAAKLNSAAEELEALTPGDDYVDGEGVFLADSREEAEEISSEYGGSLQSYSHGVAVVKFAESTVDAFKDTATTMSATKFVDPNYKFHLTAELNAPSYSVDSTLTNDPYADDENTYYQYFHDKIKTVNAHSVTTGAGAKVAVIDTGCIPGHEDSRFDEKHAQYVNKFTYPDDYIVGHGTHCTGVIHEAKGNSAGGFGVAPDAEVYSIKIADSVSFDMDEVVTGMAAAIDDGVNVISMSLGSPSKSDALQEAVNEAYKRGILVVASAGNEDKDEKNYPGACDHVLCVAATDADDNLADYSNYGDWVDIAAPGTYITSTFPHYSHLIREMKAGWIAGSVSNNSYGCISGTSMATPVVAGVAALCYSAYPEFTTAKNSSVVDAVTDILLNTANDTVYSYGGHSVTGLVQADKAVSIAKGFSSSDYTIVDPAGNHASYYGFGKIAKGKSVKLHIGDKDGETKGKAIKTAAKSATWKSSNESVISVKKGKVKCSKNAAVGATATITATVGGETLQYVYTVTNPIVGAGYCKYSTNNKGDYKMQITKTVKATATAGSSISLSDPNSNTGYINLVYSKKSDSIKSGNWGYAADDEFDYIVSVKKGDISKGNITLTEDIFGKPVKATFAKAGTYNIKLSSGEGSKATFNYKITVR